MKQLILKDYQSKADIVFSEFQEFTKIQDEMDMNNITELDEQFLQNRLLKIFYNINPSDQRDLQQSQIELLVNKLLTILQGPKSKFKNIVVISDEKFGFIPDFEKITAGELIDMDAYLKDKNFVALTALLYRPLIGEINKKGEYRVEDYKGENIEKFKFVTLDVIEGYMELFTTSYQILKATTLTHTGQHQKTEKTVS